MTDERRTFDRLPPDPHRLRWRDWLARHGADPRRAVVPGWIERRPARHQIAYSAYVPDAVDDTTVAVDDTGEPLTTTHVCQLESAPEPFPDDYGTPA